MTIETLRLSFVFTETLLDGGKGGQLGDFTSELGYAAMIDALQAGTAAEKGLGLPWPYPAGQNFWDSYLHDKVPGDAGGKLCFEKLVPLRMARLADSVRVAMPEARRAGIEGFCFPHGTGLLVTVDIVGSLDLDGAGTLAQRVRYDKVFEAGWAGRAAAPAVGIEQLATAALDRIRALGFGAEAAGTRSKPFSIATVVCGRDVDQNQPPAHDSATHRLLNGLANWPRQWQKIPAPPLVAGQTQLDVRSATALPGNLLFAGKRGRAVWFPGLFLPGPTPVHSLSCYHRNLSLGSLQTESLLMLAGAVVAAQGQLPNSVQRLGRLAAGLLGRLHTGTKTYRSDSLRAQIAQSDERADVDALRQQHGMAPLA